MMKKDFVFNFLWWFASPFFVIFFFVLFLLHFEGISFLRPFLLLVSILVVAPLLVDWIFTNIFKLQKNERAIVDLVAIVTGFIYAYIFYIKYISLSMQVLFIVFGLSIVLSFILFFIKSNQYSFLLGVLLAVSLLFSVTQMQDLVYVIVCELIFSAILFRYFIIYRVDDFKGISITYIGGIFSVGLLFFFATLFF